MLLHTDDPRTAARDPLDEGAEALIREARRRTLRRRARRGSVAALGLGLVVLLVVVLTRGGEGVIAATGSRPFVNVKAFSGEGNLAFISRGRLWVLDGAARTVRELPTPRGYVPADPSFSRDGRWLAYLAETSSSSLYASDQLWLARADGADAHAVTRLRVTQEHGLIGWSPTADLVAVGVGVSRHAPYGAATAVDVVSPNGARRSVIRFGTDHQVRLGAMEDAVWSPDGKQIAVSTWGQAGTVVRAVTVADPHRSTVWFSIRNNQDLASVPVGSGAGTRSVIADLAGWWPGWGVAFWVYADGMAHNNDQTPIAVLRSPGATPKLLADTLSDGITDAVAAGPGGRLAVVAATTGPGRAIGQGKSVERCPPGARTCVPLPGANVWTGPDTQTCRPCTSTPAAGLPGSGVSLDPAWSPNGALLAYVKAPTAANGDAWPDGAWYQDHALYVWNPRTDVGRRVGSVDGASLPTWARNGRELLYVSNDGLWMTPLATGKPVEIEYPLYPQSEWHPRGIVGYSGNVAYYGQVPWSQQFSWSSSK